MNLTYNNSASNTIVIIISCSRRVKTLNKSTEMFKIIHEWWCWRHRGCRCGETILGRSVSRAFPSPPSVRVFSPIPSCSVCRGSRWRRRRWRRRTCCPGSLSHQASGNCFWEQRKVSRWFPSDRWWRRTWGWPRRRSDGLERSRISSSLVHQVWGRRRSPVPTVVRDVELRYKRKWKALRLRGGVELGFYVCLKRFRCIFNLLVKTNRFFY